ncbi:hypothetical protein PFISCL1PPCAC_26903, partial [Pristionchus fissidentatus]
QQSTISALPIMVSSAAEITYLKTTQRNIIVGMPFLPQGTHHPVCGIKMKIRRDHSNGSSSRYVVQQQQHLHADSPLKAKPDSFLSETTTPLDLTMTKGERSAISSDPGQNDDHLVTTAAISFPQPFFIERLSSGSAMKVSPALLMSSSGPPS